MKQNQFYYTKLNVNLILEFFFHQDNPMKKNQNKSLCSNPNQHNI